MGKFKISIPTSIGKKQIVAVTGLLLILYVIAHLAGNLFIYGGPEPYNHYAKKLTDLRPALYIVEFGLLAVFLVHIYVTYLLVLENMKARANRYSSFRPKGGRSWSTRLRTYTGTIILAFVVWHLLDFTFVDKQGPRSFVGEESLGLYGIVYNSFTDPVHSILYIIAMCALGFHLNHGVQSFMQTFGFNHPRYTPLIHKISHGFATLVVIGYSSIPIYVLLDSLK